MTAIALKREVGSVELVGDRLLINDLELTGTIATLARGADAAGEELAPLVALVAEVGACVVQHGGSQTVVSALATAADRLERALSDGAAQLPEELRKGSTELLELLRNELKVGLAGFDATRVDSVQNQLKDASGELVKKAVEDLMADGGAFAALVEKVATQLQVLGRTNGDLVERITSLVERAEANLRLTDAHERSTQKGVPFEEHLLPELEAIHGPLGDTVTHVAREYGAKDTYVGDFVITINSRETRGRDVRLVVEAKTGRLSAPQVAAELEQARANREAAAAIIVFDGVEDAKSSLGGRHFGQRPGGDFVVVADPDEWSPLALEVACRHARALAIASLEPEVVLEGKWLQEHEMNTTERIVLVFGAGLAPDGWMNAMQVVPLLGGDAAAWTTVQSALEKLEYAGYLVRAAHGGSWFYRRELLGMEAAARILNDDAVPIFAEAASSEAGVRGWQPDAGSPQSLSGMIGQQNARYQIRLNVDWAKGEGRAAKPMLFSGQSGQGKTMVGGLVARELGVPFVHLSMADADIAEVKSALTLVADGGVVLFDELHAAKARLRNALLVELGPDELPFTPIAATTNLGVLSDDIVRRFRRVIEFAPYSIDEADQIAAAKARANGINLDADLSLVIARAARCNPAKIGVLVDECVMLTSRYSDVPSKETFLEHLRMRGSDERGIEELDRRLLYALSEFFEGTAGIMRLATAAEVGPEHALERLHGLVREGLVRTAGRAGWKITEAGSVYLGLRAA